MAGDIDAALRGIWHKYHLGEISSADLSLLHDAYALASREREARDNSETLAQAARLLRFWAADRQRQLGRWTAHEQAGVDCAIKLEALRASRPAEEHDRPETPRQGVKTPDDAQGRSPLVPALGDRPAGRVASPAVPPDDAQQRAIDAGCDILLVPPAPLGLEEQLRAIWAEEYDRSVSPTAVPRNEHWRMAALRRAATETPLARLGEIAMKWVAQSSPFILHAQVQMEARALNLLPEPDKDTK